jgi:hypothetical protein
MGLTEVNVMVAVQRILRPYRPSNGTEGEAFQEKFCCNCVRDRAVNLGGDDPQWEDGCQILARALADGGVPEWVEMDSGPFCTAYVPDEGQDPNESTKLELERAGQLRLIV